MAGGPGETPSRPGHAPEGVDVGKRLAARLHAIVTAVGKDGNDRKWLGLSLYTSRALR